MGLKTTKLLSTLESSIADASKMLALVSAYILVLAGTAHAQITVSTVLASIETGKRPIANVVVRNGSDNVLYVNTTVQLVLNPGGDKDAKYVSAENLLVSPRKFSIPAQGVRSVRLVYKTALPELEEVYRVAFEPQDRGFGQEMISEPAPGRRAMIRVLTGMGMLIFVDPKIPQRKLEWERKGGEITFRNPGNAHMYLESVRACSKENENCEDFHNKRIYGGMNFSLKLPAEKTLYATQREGLKGPPVPIAIAPSDGDRGVLGQSADSQSAPGKVGEIKEGSAPSSSQDSAEEPSSAAETKTPSLDEK